MITFAEFQKITYPLQHARGQTRALFLEIPPSVASGWKVTGQLSAQPRQPHSRATP